MILRISICNKITLVLVLLIKRLVHGIDYAASFPNCPGNYQRINNGCYFFVNTTAATWKTAHESCINNYSTPGAVTHLIAFESQAETISLSYWFKGYKYTNNFWTDGIIGNKSKRVWAWNGQDYTSFGYLKDSGQTGRKYSYLKNNNSATYEYEMRDDNGNANMAYICEAQVPCNETDNQCRNNGTCYVNSGRVLCQCLDGFEGSLCEIQVDNCDSVPCLHGATCDNLVNNYTCSCTPYYKGRNCDIEISFKYESGRTLALSIAVSVVGLILLILCLMDLPWHGFMKRFFPSKEEKDKKLRNKLQKSQEKTNDFKAIQNKKAQNNTPTKSQLLASEEEMLKRFKLILSQPNNKQSLQSQPSVDRSVLSDELNVSTSELIKQIEKF